MFNNFKNIDKVVYGRGAFDQLDHILSEQRHLNDGFMVFVVDHYFHDKQDFIDRIPVKENDVIRFIDVDPKEPTTEQIDELRDDILANHGLPAGIIGIGGGSIMDIAKAGSLMFTNEGSSTLYQGLNLIKIPGIYSLGVPTISGTGAECSMTAVLSGPEKKLGLKCDWTVFNQVILDPDLTATVDKNQWFYTGMDTYIHCIEAQSGQYFNTYSEVYGDQSLKLCRDVFLGDKSGQTPVNNEKLMMASLFGGMSLTYSEVGACHALSYGMSFIFGTKHGYANCLAFNHLEEFYGDSIAEFREMVKKNNIDLPQNLAKDWTDEEISQMAEIAYNLPHMWRHAIGDDWEQKWTRKDIEALYRRL